MTQPTRPEDDELAIDRVTGELLRVGVLAAAAVLLVGGVLFLAHHGGEPNPDHSKFPQHPKKLHLHEVLAEARAGSGRAIVLIGLVLLIATPVLRVAFTAVAFAWRRDWVYVVIPLIVLGVLIAGVLTGQVG
jgi:uncharacterized membrane protein